MFRNAWKSISNMCDILFDFESTDESDDDHEENPRSYSTPRNELRLRSTSQRQRRIVSIIPCEFCNVSCTPDQILSHQISCSHNPSSTSSSFPPYPSHFRHKDIVPTAPIEDSHYINNSIPSTAITNSDILESLRCPITQEIFVHPVLAEDGYTYEEDAIKEWIQKNGTSPITRQQLTIAGLRPNRAVSDAVEVFRRNQRSNQIPSARSTTTSLKY